MKPVGAAVTRCTTNHNVGAHLCVRPLQPVKFPAQMAPTGGRTRRSAPTARLGILAQFKPIAPQGGGKSAAAFVTRCQWALPV